MPIEVVRSFAERVGAYVRQVGLEQIDVLFHGGEPLLLPCSFYDEVVPTIRSALPPTCNVKFGMQSNASLLTSEVIAMLARHGISISLSIDGPRSAQDRHRRFADGSSSFIPVCAAVDRLMSHPLGSDVFGGILAVVDLLNEPEETYSFHASLGTPAIDYLWPDGHHDRLPPGILDYSTDTQYAMWSERVFDKWFRAPDEQPQIRFFENSIRLLLGGQSTVEGIGAGALSLLTIQTDGEIQDSDIMSVAYEHAGRFGNGCYLNSSSFTDLAASRGFHTQADRYRSDHLSAACQRCYWATICSGGLLPHRYGSRHDFAAPSVYCGNLSHILGHIRRAVIADVRRAELEHSGRSNTPPDSSQHSIATVCGCAREQDCQAIPYPPPIAVAQLDRERVAARNAVSEPTADIIVPAEPCFRESVEPGIRRTVRSLALRLGLILSSCQAGNLPNGNIRYPSIGILPRSRDEAAWTLGFLQDVASIVNAASSAGSHVAVEQQVSESTDSCPIIDIRFFPTESTVDDSLLQVRQQVLEFEHILDGLLKLLPPAYLRPHPPQDVQTAWEKADSEETASHAPHEFRIGLGRDRRESDPDFKTMKDALCNTRVNAQRLSGNNYVVITSGALYPDERASVCAQVDSGRVTVMLNHAWALLAWMRAMRAFPPDQSICITHFDSHSDMMGPMIGVDNANATVTNRFTAERAPRVEMDFWANAIGSTAVGPGSFLLPFLYLYPDARILNVSPTNGNASQTAVRRGSVRPVKSFVFPDVERPLEFIDDNEGPTSWANVTVDCVQDVDPHSIWILDIDCDYFANTYDGHIHLTPGERTYQRSSCEDLIEGLCSVLSPGSRTPDIVTIAVSPDFCPLLVAAKAIGRVLSALGRSP